MYIIYFFYALGFAHMVVAITTLFHSGHDPFFIAMSFIVGVFGAVSLCASYVFYKVKLMTEYPSHAVDEDIQWKRIQDEPAYLRRKPEQLEFNFNHDDRS